MESTEEGVLRKGLADGPTQGEEIRDPEEEGPNTQTTGVTWHVGDSRRPWSGSVRASSTKYEHHAHMEDWDECTRRSRRPAQTTYTLQVGQRQPHVSDKGGVDSGHRTGGGGYRPRHRSGRIGKHFCEKR